MLNPHFLTYDEYEYPVTRFLGATRKGAYDNVITRLIKLCSIVEVEGHPFNHMFLSVKPVLQLGAILFVVCLCACTNRNINSIEGGELALSSSFEHRILILDDFSDDFTFSVYIPGDGRPWSERGINMDPSPSYSLSYELMQLGSGARAFIARPCYYATQSDNCHPGLWTSARYSEQLLQSYEHVIRQMLEQREFKSLNLIGYSGGGQIATLLAQRLPQTKRLITFAANLDHVAWTEHHDYSPLQSSRNAASVKLPRHIEQYHFSGGKDKNVPTFLNQDFFTLNAVRPIILPNFDHQCCWTRFWQQHHQALLQGNPKPEDFIDR
jgi:hypothetical protein